MLNTNEVILKLEATKYIQKTKTNKQANTLVKLKEHTGEKNGIDDIEVLFIPLAPKLKL